MSADNGKPDEDATAEAQTDDAASAAKTSEEPADEAASAAETDTESSVDIATPAEEGAEATGTSTVPEPPPPDPGTADVVPPSDLPPPADLAPPSETVLDQEIPPPTSVPVPKPAPTPTVLPSAGVTEISPSQGPTVGGTKVSLEGTHLFRESIVRFGGELAATVGATVDRELRVEAPPHPKPGPVDVSIQNPGSEITVIEKAFRYEPLPAPKITSVAPKRGAVGGGTEISITGKHFVESTVVLLGGTRAELVTFVDATSLEVKTPPGEPGKMIDVAVENPDGKRDQARRAFLYDERYK